MTLERVPAVLAEVTKGFTPRAAETAAKLFEDAFAASAPSLLRKPDALSPLKLDDGLGMALLGKEHSVIAAKTSSHVLFEQVGQYDTTYGIADQNMAAVVSRDGRKMNGVFSDGTRFSRLTREDGLRDTTTIHLDTMDGLPKGASIRLITQREAIGGEGTTSISLNSHPLLGTTREGLALGSAKVTFSDRTPWVDLPGGNRIIVNESGLSLQSRFMMPIEGAATEIKVPVHITSIEMGDIDRVGANFPFRVFMRNQQGRDIGRIFELGDKHTTLNGISDRGVFLMGNAWRPEQRLPDIGAHIHFLSSRAKGLAEIAKRGQ